MAWCPETDRLVDPFDGQRDLGLKLVRAVGEAHARLSEDGLRAMRAVRFAAVLGFRIHDELEMALADTLEVFSKVSIERIAIELRKTLMSSRPGWGVHFTKLRSTWCVLTRDRRLAGRILEQICNALDRSARDFETRVALLMSPVDTRTRVV